MGRTKQLLVEEDWERAWELDYMYRMEQQRLEEQEFYREPAKINIINKTKKKHESTVESEHTFLPF